MEARDMGMFIVIGISVVIFIIALIMRNQQTKFKKDITSNIIKEIFPNADYRPDEYISRADYDEIGLRRGMYFQGGDLLYAKTKGNRKFRVCEINTYDRIKTGKTHSRVTIFQGTIISFEYPKKFSTPVAIQKKGFKGAGSLKTWGEHKIETENVEFNKKFKIHAKDDETAFYICTPKFMERMLELSKIYKWGMLISFKDRWVHIALPKVDLFKAPLFGSKNPKKLSKFSEKTKNDLNRIDDFINELEIDSKLFSN